MKPVGWSKEKGFYYDPDGAYYRRQDVDALLQVECTCRMIEMCDRCEAIGKAQRVTEESAPLTTRSRASRG